MKSPSTTSLEATLVKNVRSRLDKMGYGSRVKLAQHLGITPEGLNLLISKNRTDRTKFRPFQLKYIEPTAKFFRVSPRTLLK